MNNITETVTDPGVGAVIGGATVVANMAGNLPTVINVFVAIYFALMVVHKLYQMYKEYKHDHRKPR